MNPFRSTTPWRRFHFWAASALITAVLVAAFAVPTAPARAEGPAPASPVEIPCGERTPVIIIPGGTRLDVAYFGGPNALEDMDRYMVDPAMETDVWNAILKRVREDENIGSRWVCQGCATPGACVIWPVELCADEPHYYYDWEQVYDVWVLEIVFIDDVYVYSICTEC